MITNKSILITFIASALCFGSCFASQQQRLKKVDRRIATVKADLSHKQTQLNQQQSQLATLENELAKLNQLLQDNQKQLSNINDKLALLRQQNQQLQLKLDNQQHLLASQISKSYRLGEQPLLKLLLSETNPDKIQRLLMYYRYFNQQRLETIHKYKQTLSDLDQNTTEIEQRQLQLLTVTKKSQQDKLQYQKRFKQRQAVVATLNRRINTQQQKLSQLLTNKQRLAKAIQLAHQKSPQFISGSSSFKQQKGHYPWPTQGKIGTRYGSNIANSQLKRDGVLIRAKKGQSVHTIADGRVIFAKWMPSYGQLIIIDHGNGYMTLYGRNQTLLKQVGDTVKAGQSIATVGNSGGYQESSLYFAIRHNAKPLNPTQWCHQA